MWQATPESLFWMMSLIRKDEDELQALSIPCWFACQVCADGGVGGVTTPKYFQNWEKGGQMPAIMQEKLSQYLP